MSGRARPILAVPDARLRAVAAPVERFDEELAALVADLFATMYAAPGRGLAAPQVGVGLRVFVMDAGWRDGAPAPVAFVNPEVVEASDEVATRDEGCLSIPGRLSTVTRPARVVLRWRDVDGTAREGAFEGFEAACVQHEADHLDGVLVTDRESAGRDA